MKGDECKDKEIVVRGILEEHYEKEADRFYSTLFKGPKTSLCREGVCSKNEIIHGFISQIHNPLKNHMLIGLGIAKVGLLKKICIEYTHNPTTISIIEDPLDGSNPDEIANPSHALLINKLSPGLAKEIPKNITIEWIDVESFISNDKESNKGCMGWLFV